VELSGAGQDPKGGSRVGYETTFTLKRSDFGMTNMLDAIGDEVRLIVSIEGIKK
jgi:polyisoprenoid-binding protein YceI